MTTLVHETGQYAETVSPREYITSLTPDERPRFGARLSNEEYAKALSELVTACADMVLYDPETEEIFVAKRNIEPQAGSWVEGGRRKAGETTMATLNRNARRDRGIEQLDPNRLTRVEHYNFIWPTRAQEPTVNQHGQTIDGSHQVSDVYLYTLAPGEKATLAADDLTHEEYKGGIWMSPLEILAQEDRNPGSFHPAYVQIVTDVLDTLTHSEPLTAQKLAELPSSEAEIALNTLAGAARARKHEGQ